MNDCKVGTGSPLHPPIAITDVPEDTSSAAADCEPFVAADHGVCVSASAAARSLLVDSSPVHWPTRAMPSFGAVGIDPGGGAAGVATEKAVVPPSAAKTPTATAVARSGCAPKTSTATAAVTATAASVHGSNTGPK